MRKILGYEVDKLPLVNLTRVANLIEFEGPILSHYVDEYKNNYLYYWVDQDEKFNRWLIWKTEEILLMKYLSKEISLDYLFAKPGDNVYVVDIGSSLESQKCFLTYSNLIDDVYRPEPESYFEFDLPSVYSEKINSFSLLEEWKSRALYFNVEPINKRYDITIGLEDIWSVFENLGKSFNEYVGYVTRNRLSERITDQNRIKVASKTLSSINRLRFVYLNLNSFHFGVAADILNIDSASIDPSLEDLRSNVLVQFQQDVLDNDFSSNTDIDLLIEKFPDEAIRKKIFEPVVKIINNDNIKLNISDYSKHFDRNYGRLSKEDRVRLTPSKPTIQKDLTDQGHALLVAYIVADKNDIQGTLFPKDVSNRLAYFKEIAKFPIEIDTIDLADGQKINFKRSVSAEISFEDNQFVLSYEPLGILLVVNDQKELEKKFKAEIAKVYLQFLSGDKSYELFFNELI